MQAEEIIITESHRYHHTATNHVLLNLFIVKLIVVLLFGGDLTMCEQKKIKLI